MITIIVPNIDSKIWNIDQKTIEIVKALQTEHTVTIDLNHEGPCATALGLYDLLDSICKNFIIEKSRIQIITANAIEQNRGYQILRSPLVYLSKYKEVKFVVSKDFNNIKHFGIFIGRSNWNRLYLASKIYTSYKDKSIISYHYNNDTCADFDNLSTLIGTKKTSEITSELLQNFPIILDPVEHYPIIDPAHMNILKYYNNIFLDVVCETYFTGHTFYPTEKTVRSIIAETPFLVYGPVDYLKNLQKLGFKTFNEFWSEDYDQFGDITRAKIIEDRLNFLSNCTTKDLQSLYTNMQPILKHNKQLLDSMTVEKFYRAFKQ